MPSGLSQIRLSRPINPGPLDTTNPVFYMLEILKVNDISILHN